MDDDQVRDAIGTMVDAVNRGDFATAASSFRSQPSIIEDLPPFRWEGPSAVGDWLTAMGANAATLKASAIEMKLGEAKQIEVCAGRSYACFRGTLRLATAAGELSADGTLTFVLVKEANHWLIDTLVWGGSRPE